MGEVLQKVFKTVVKEISQYLPPLGESVSEVPYFIQEHRSFAKVLKNFWWYKETLAKGNTKGDQKPNQQ